MEMCLVWNCCFRQAVIVLYVFMNKLLDICNIYFYFALVLAF